MPELRVFLADDHVVVREGLKALINAQADMTVVGESADGEGACERVPALRPDVVVMDVSMHGMSGARATERLVSECPGVRVLALSVHEDKGYLRQLLAAGAAGYALKRSAAEDLIRAVRAVAAGDVYLDPALTGKVIGTFLRKPSGESTAGKLSERELEVGRLIAAGYSNKEIAARVEIGVKTVETYKARVLEKLGLRSRADLVRYAFNQGWLEGL